ncbi:hypothetical protein [Streptodolium elevatio]|uniref:Uncharacterized protein n=1 Tax=Streptodolium elevatio TaxID=3157996 RepID=A0ABV3DGW1_9ACTN
MDADELLERILQAHDYANEQADRLAAEAERDGDPSKAMNGASYRTIADVLGRIPPRGHWRSGFPGLR